MASEKIAYQRVGLKYGFMVGVAHIAYFLLMGILDLHHIVELSFISSLFLIVGIVMAISSFKRAKNGMINYFQGLGIGVTTGVVSSVLLAIFLVIYISLIDASYLMNLQASAFFPEGLSLLALFALTIVYGSWPGFFISFIAMQWYKRPDHTMSERV